MTRWQQDVLGSGFEQLTIELPAGAPATLVRYVGAAAQWAPPTLAGADVLYLHGWSDYFFQRELAEFWHRAGANFYALDLHHYGRSLRPGQVPGQVTSLTEYDDDIAAALTAMGRRVVAAGRQDNEPAAEPDPAGDAAVLDGNFWEAAWDRFSMALSTWGHRAPRSTPAETGERPLVLLGHSTGGLTLSLWASRHPGAASAVVLNSPWLEFQATEVGRAVVAPLIQARSKFRPLAPLPSLDPGFYTRAVSKRFDGEWEYKQQWRPDRGFPVTASFINAVFQGQAQVARGLSIDAPVLVMLSDKSYLQPKWSSEALEADVVLNVDSVARRAPDLGPDVTLHRVSEAFHDVFLSPAPIRAHAYAGMGRWAEAALDAAALPRWAERVP